MTSDGREVGMRNAEKENKRPTSNVQRPTSKREKEQITRNNRQMTRVTVTRDVRSRVLDFLHKSPYFVFSSFSRFRDESFSFFCAFSFVFS